MIHIKRELSDLASDIILPYTFFEQDMLCLDEVSLKCYLYLQARVQAGHSSLDEEELAQRLGVSERQLAEIFTILQKRKLLQLTGEGCELTDLRKRYVERKDKQDALQQTRDRSEQEAIIRQINDTFYNGLMPLPFYHSIDRWFTEYQFEGSVVYALFNELKRYETLHSDSYAEKIAANWASKNICSFKDLSNYYEERNSLNRYADILRKRLRQKQPLNIYQMEFLERWLQEWQLDFSLVDEAFKRASATPQTQSFNYVEGILRNWKEAGLANLEDIYVYEEERKQAYQEKGKRRQKEERKKSARGNFSQRDYSADSFEEYYRSLDFLDREDQS